MGPITVGSILEPLDAEALICLISEYVGDTQSLEEYKPCELRKVSDLGSNDNFTAILDSDLVVFKIGNDLVYLQRSLFNTPFVLPYMNQLCVNLVSVESIITFLINILIRYENMGCRELKESIKSAGNLKDQARILLDPRYRNIVTNFIRWYISRMYRQIWNPSSFRHYFIPLEELPKIIKINAISYNTYLLLHPGASEAEYDNARSHLIQSGRKR